ncbi:hypothetical protein CEXT_778491 [Caerostris extrusa]|uniref:Uncharacterized protein n=1 Tax=Caerostris extrusa TaxID=172846 RepID=A0AAV4TXX4_CAEEX|nr:hypothetical protein CEXT_778491 [Caerostris extrusa]
MCNFIIAIHYIVQLGNNTKIHARANRSVPQVRLIAKGITVRESDTDPSRGVWNRRKKTMVGSVRITAVHSGPVVGRNPLTWNGCEVAGAALISSTLWTTPTHKPGRRYRRE